MQIKDKLQQHNLEKNYECYHLKDDGLLTYKNIWHLIGHNLNISYLHLNQDTINVMKQWIKQCSIN